MADNNKETPMEFARDILHGFCFGSGFILAVAFFRVALHINLLN